MEKGGLVAAFRDHGVTAEKQVVWADEMRLGLRGQVRRVWAPHGVKVEQPLQIDYEWTYLALGVDVLGGRLKWCWIESMKGEDIARAVRRWQEGGIEVVVWDGARGHKAQVVRETGLTLIGQPPYSPQLNPAERVFEEVRRRVEGQVYPDLEAKKRAVEEVLEELAAYPEKVRRLTGWKWILQAFQSLSRNMALL